MGPIRLLAAHQECREISAFSASGKVIKILVG
jgi:hypothetical protein